MLTDGPYLESKEHLGGFWVIDAPDLDVALRLAAEGSKACRGKVEVRPVPDRGVLQGTPRVVTERAVEDAITRAHRHEWARVVASLTRRLGDLGAAEDAAAEAFATAVERWPRDGVPPNPGGWLMTTASRKAIDRLRREARREEKHREAQVMVDVDPAAAAGSRSTTTGSG